MFHLGEEVGNIKDNLNLFLLQTFIIYSIAIMIYDKPENTDDCLLNYRRKKLLTVGQESFGS